MNCILDCKIVQTLELHAKPSNIMTYVRLYLRRSSNRLGYLLSGPSADVGSIYACLGNGSLLTKKLLARTESHWTRVLGNPAIG